MEIFNLTIKSPFFEKGTNGKYFSYLPYLPQKNGLWLADSAGWPIRGLVFVIEKA